MKALLPITLFVFSAIGTWKFSRVPSEYDQVSMIVKSNREVANLSRNRKTPWLGLARMGDVSEQAFGMIALASSVSIEEIPTLLEGGDLEILEPLMRELVMEILAERWLETDPAAAIKWAILHKEDQVNRGLVAWAINDSQEALSFIKSMPRGQHAAMIQGLLLGLAAKNPDMAMEIAKDHLVLDSDPFIGESGVGSISFRLASHDLKYFRSIRDDWPSELRAQSAPALLAVLFKTNFSEALELIEIENLGLRNFRRCFLYDNEGEIPAKLVGHFDDLPASWQERILQTLPQEVSFENRLAWIEVGQEGLGIDDENYDQLIESLSGQLRSGSQEASDRVMAILNDTAVPSISKPNLILSQVFSWPYWDKEGLRQWFGKLNDPVIADRAERILAFFEKSERRPAEVRNPQQLMRVLLEGNDFGKIFHLASWSDANVQATLSDYVYLSKGDKERVIHHFGGDEEIGILPTEFAATLIEDALNADLDGEEATRLFMQLPNFVSDWAEEGPARAAEWAKGLPPGMHRSEALQQIVLTWSRYDPEEARDWMESLDEQIKLAIEE